MASLRKCHMYLFILPVLLYLNACAALTVASIVPGALVEAVANQFSGEEISLPVSMHTSLAAVQKSLRSMKLDVDMLEKQKEGYSIAFRNKKLTGHINLIKQTPLLTTLYIKVRTSTREESIEHAIVEAVRTETKHNTQKANFHYAGYHYLRQQPTIHSSQVGWFRLGSDIQAYKSNKPDWLKCKLPSGTVAYFKNTSIVKESRL